MPESHGILSAMISFNQKLTNMQRTRRYDQYAGKQTANKAQSIETECIQLLGLAGKNIKMTNKHLFKDLRKM